MIVNLSLLPRWFHLFTAITISILIASGWWLLMHDNTLMQSQYAIEKSINTINISVHRYHLWLEEYLNAPTEINHTLLTKAIKQATQTSAMLKQQLDHQQNYDHNQLATKLQQKISQWQMIGLERIKKPQQSATDSPLDVRFDTLFAKIQNHLSQLQQDAQTQLNNRQKNARLHIVLLAAIALFMMVFFWWLLIVIDRRRCMAFQQTSKLAQQVNASESAKKEALKAAKKADNARLKQHDKLQLLFEQVPLGIIEWSSDFEVREWNTTAEYIFGYSANEAIGRAAEGLILNQSMMNEVATLTHELINQTGGTRSINHNITKDGRTILCEWYNTTLVDRDGATIGVASVVIDITKQQQLKESHQRMVTMIENTLDLVIIAGADKEIIYLNQAGKQMLGLKTTRVINEITINDFLASPADIALLDETFSQAAQKNTAIRKDITLLDHQGEEIISNCIAMVQRDNTDKISHYMLIAHDLRHEQAAQAKIEHGQRLESLGVLAGGIAHDFNNILTVILGNAALARSRLDDQSPAFRHLHHIESASQRAADLCKQMLAYSGKGKFIVKPINLSAMVEEMVRLLEVSIDKGVVLKYHLESQLPSIEADASQVQQIIMNLVINASESIEGKSGVVSITTGVMKIDEQYLDTTTADDAVASGHYIFLEVSDTGCGMDKQTQTRLFDPFFTTKFTGRGLGMSAILGIVRGHGGAIKCYSEPAKGTTFKVLFPRSDKALLINIEAKDNDHTHSMHGSVLVVDDEKTILEVAGMIFEEMGLKCIKAIDGEEGVDKFRQHHPDLIAVLLDMTMPKKDGVTTFREIQQINPSVPVILSSGYNEQDATSRFAGKGLAAFIQKPYLPESLRETLTNVIGEKKVD